MNKENLNENASSVRKLMKKINSLALTAVLAVGLIFPVNVFSMPNGAIVDRPGAAARSNQFAVQTTSEVSGNISSQDYHAAGKYALDLDNVMSGVFSLFLQLAHTGGGAAYAIA